jgi:hypothetical protein
MMVTARTAVINVQERRISPADAVYQFSMIHNKKNRYLPEEKYQIGICIEDSLSLL